MREETVTVQPRGRVVVAGRKRDDDTDLMANADAVVGVGQGVPPDRYAGAATAARRCWVPSWAPPAR